MKLRRVLAAALLLAGCGEEDPATLIADFEDQSLVVECRALATDNPIFASITNVRAASDSTVFVVDGVGRQVAILDAEARVLLRLELPESGPGSVARLFDATVSGDSLIVIADGGRNRLLGLAPTGAELWSTQLDFPLQSVDFAGDRLLVSAVGMDHRIPGLVHELRGTRLVPLGIPFIPHADALARMFVNSASLVGRPDGAAVVAHEMIWPRAWLVPARGDPLPVDVPVPAAVAEQIGHVPTMPMHEDDAAQLLTPVIGMTIEPNSGDIFYVTRAAPKEEHGSQKAIIRADERFAYIASVRLPLNAVKLVYLSAYPDSLIVSDYDLNWYRCPVPPRNRDAGS
ncbi:MAG TPA: hypothetical protein VF039_13130 [Longimicrobiales bacterium]